MPLQFLQCPGTNALSTKFGLDEEIVPRVFIITGNESEGPVIELLSENSSALCRTREKFLS